jgi:hypothetical protein
MAAMRCLSAAEAAEYHWSALPSASTRGLPALAAGAALGTALEAGQSADASFDFAAALRTHVAAGTIAAVVSDDVDDAVAVSD